MVHRTPLDRTGPQLSQREELVLRYIVQHYILTANPVGSRYLSKRLDEESISAATIRNTMADLEEKGYITHPHTSAGRVPTDAGYRFYVDALVQTERPSEAEQARIRRNLDPELPQTALMKEAARVIAHVSEQLGIVTAPELLDAVLERLDIVHLSSTRLLVVLSVQAGLIRTVTIEVQEEVQRDRLDAVVVLLNERLAGLTLREIRATLHERMKDAAPIDATLQFLLEKGEAIFAEPLQIERVRVSPSHNILRHPEFADPEQLRGIVELLENEEMVIHLLDRPISGSAPVDIVIGREHDSEWMAEYSLITTRYRVGGATGTIGLIGPKRMNYARMIGLVEYIATTLGNNFP